MKLYLCIWVEGDNAEQALQYANKLFEDIGLEIIENKLDSIDAYWKMDGVFVVKYELLVERPGLEKLQEQISDSWLVLGTQGEELLASRTNEKCTYMRDKIVMANIVVK